MYQARFQISGDGFVSVLIAMGCRVTHSVDLHLVAHKWEGGCLHAVHSYGSAAKLFSVTAAFSYSTLQMLVLTCTCQKKFTGEKMHCDWVLDYAAFDQGSTHLLFCQHPHSQHGRKMQYTRIFKMIFEESIVQNLTGYFCLWTVWWINTIINFSL